MTEDELIAAYRNLGPLALALSKAQAAFPPIPRDTKVEVRTRTGGTYQFSYAPLETIFNAVRGPLSDNGLAIAQLLDGPDLVTVLFHESGSYLEARTPIPLKPDGTVQDFGSAITYLRRYSIVAMLGVASEDDDDGNAAVGNAVRPRPRKAEAPAQDTQGGMIGFASAGKGDADMNLRMTPTGHVFAFRLTENLGGTKGFKVVVRDSLAEKLAAVAEQLEGARVTCWGQFTEEQFEKKQPDGGTVAIPYRVLHLQRIETPMGLFVKAADDLEPALSASLEEHVSKRVTAVTPDPDEDDEITQAYGVRRMQEGQCGEVDTSPMELGTCREPKGHKGPHKSGTGSWPILRV